MSKDTVRKLNLLQHTFLRMALDVGPGALIASLCWESCLLDVELRIWLEKLMLCLDLRNRDDSSSLSGMIYKEQVDNGWPGLALEANSICDKLNIFHDLIKLALYLMHKGSQPTFYFSYCHT